MTSWNSYSSKRPQPQQPKDEQPKDNTPLKLSISTDATEDFKINLPMFEKYLPTKERIRIKEIACKHLVAMNGATRYMDMKAEESWHPFEWPKELTDPQDIYEINFRPMQYLLNLIGKYNMDPRKVRILCWGCGPAIIDYHLDKLGFNMTSHDNWSQLGKPQVINWLKDIEDTEGYKHTINFVDDVELLCDMDFDILYDTGNRMDIERVVQNPNVKLIFTWLPEDRMGGTNITYLKENFTRKNFNGIVAFFNNDHFKGRIS